MPDTSSLYSADEFYRYMVDSPSVRIVLFFEALLSIGFLAYLLFSYDFESVTGYIAFTMLLWFVYIFFSSAMYQSYVVEPRKKKVLRDMILQKFGEEGVKVLDFIEEVP